jgi:hypothetical protein
MIGPILRILGALAMGVPLGGCQAMEPSTETSQAAVLQSADAETLARVRAMLSQATGRAEIDLGAGDPTREPVLIVLPPPLGPLETRSLAVPIRFDIELRGARCYVVRTDTGAAFPLDGVACRKAR